MSRCTFIELLGKKFDKMIINIRRIVAEIKEEFFGMKCLSLCHDMWTTNASDNALGASIKFVTRDFQQMHLSVMLIKNNITHAAAYNAEILGETLRERFKIDVNKDVKKHNKGHCLSCLSCDGQV